MNADVHASDLMFPMRFHYTGFAFFFAWEIKMSFAMLPSKEEKLHQQSHFIELEVLNCMDLLSWWIFQNTVGFKDIFCLPALVFICTGGVKWYWIKRSVEIWKT